MIKKKIYCLFLVSIVCVTGIAQDKKIKKAEIDYKNYDYTLAIDSYEKLVADGYSDEKIYRDLGDANYQNAKYSEAASWYEKLFKLEDIAIEPEYLYRYAQSLKSNGDYQESEVWMNKYKNATDKEVRAVKLNEEPDYLKKIEEQSSAFEIKNLDINSAESDFAPSFKGQDLIFSTSRDSGITRRNIHLWNGKSFTNLYKAIANENGEFNRVEKMSKIFNKKTHESSSVFTKDGKTVYFTRNNSKNGNFSRDEKGVSRLKIYRATLIDGNWKDIIPLPFNGDNYSVAHPALSADEKQLYFASDMTGTVGESDLFVVAINEDGSFGTPVNLGKGINTESRETFPYVTKENVLYFASDGHPGLGGLDIFATKLDDLNNPYIVNLGKPINTSEDDFSLIFDSETQKGFFASNRAGGHGGDDIYSFVQVKELDLDCRLAIAGVVKNQQTNEIIANANLAITDASGTVVAEGVSDNEGNFDLAGYCEGGLYKIVATKEDFEDDDKSFAVNTDNISNVEVYLEPIEKSAPVGTDLVKYLDIEPIYFDFDKSNIREDAVISIQKVINYMKAFPEVKVQVQSHTDSRGNDAYNEALSQRRATSTSEYMILQGIDPNRISGKGFGEQRLVNDCTNQNNCSVAKHQANRRSEFIIVE
ncbi:OmpA family protein [Kriegella sp. EG-1]|nr:OmpA family protein [Flavobacteriaceae bacterium EG-1]